MFNDFIGLTIKTLVLGAVSISGLFVGTGLLEDDASVMLKSFLQGIREFGSFFIVALVIAVILIVFWKSAPIVLEAFISNQRNFLDALNKERELRDRHMILERDLRDKHMNLFREMLREQSNAVGTHIDGQTAHIDASLHEQTRVIKGIRDIAQEAAAIDAKTTPQERS